MNKEKRYQECSWIVKLYRKRYYLLCLYYYLLKPLFLNKFKSINFHYSIYLGIVDSKMKHYYTLDEVKESLKKVTKHNIKNV